MQALVLGLLTASTCAAAQDVAEDWDLMTRRGDVSASVIYSSGQGVVVRCQADSLETYIVGLPLAEAPSPRRSIDYALGSDAFRTSTWQSSISGDAIFADTPAPFARRLRAGGELQLRIEGQDGQPSRRYVLPLPRSNEAVDRVLDACGRPQDDPRDALRRSESSTDVAEAGDAAVRWARLPRLSYPDRALQAGQAGMAVLSCLVEPSGRLEECFVEVERPANADFGRYALRAVRDARLDVSNSDNLSTEDPRLVTFTVTWRLP